LPIGKGGWSIGSSSVRWAPQGVASTCANWLIDHVYLLVPAQRFVGDFLKTFVDYPPRQKASSFSVDQILEKLSQHGAGSH
jgi:hypothetical protein